MAIDFSRYQVGSHTTSSNKSHTTGTIDFSKYYVKDYTPSSKKVSSSLIDSSLVDEKNGFISKAQDFFQGVGFRQQQGTDLISNVFKKDEQIIQSEKQDLLSKINDKKESGKSTKQLEKKLARVLKIEDPTTPVWERDRALNSLRLDRYVRSAGASAGNVVAGVYNYVTKGAENKYSDEEYVKKVEKKAEKSRIWQKELEQIRKFQAGEDITSQKIAGKIEKWAEETSPTDLSYSEKVAGSFGSMGAFMIMSLGSAGNPYIPVIIESIGEAGSVYSTLREEGRDIEESSKRADLVLGANLVLNTLLNVFEFADEQKSIKLVIKSFGEEGVQEGSQQVISNLATDREWSEGVLESAILGGLSAGAMSVVYPSALPVTQNTTELNPQVIKDKILSDDKLSKSKDGQEMLKKALEAESRGEKLVVTITEDGKVLIGTQEISLETEQETQQTTKQSTQVASSGLELADNGVYAELTQQQLDFLKDEVKNIDFTKDDKPHLSPIEKLQDSELEKVTIEELRKLSPNIDKALAKLEQLDTQKTGEAKIEQGEVSEPKIKEAVEPLLKEASKYKSVKEFLESKNLDKDLVRIYNEIYGRKENTTQPSRLEKGVEGQKVEQDVQRRPSEALSKTSGQNVSKKIDFSNLAKIIKESPDGFTIKLDGKPVADGFAVSPYKGRELVVKEVSGEILEKYIDDNQDVLFKEDNYLGGWFNSIDGLFYLDVSVVKGDVDSAIKIAVDNEQIAIFDLKKLNEINTKDFIKQKLTETWKKAKKTKTTKTKSERIRKIEEYVNKKGTKFRTDPNSEVAIVEDGKITTKFLENRDVKGKKVAGWQYLYDLSKSNGLGLKQVEQELIQGVLNKDFQGQKQVNMADFKRAVIGQLMPLEAIPTKSYASYGSENLNINVDETKTYILNSPFEHGLTGHFSGDFILNLDPNDVMIKEIPAQEQNPTAKWAVVRKGVELTEANLAENVFSVAITKEEAQKWIDDHVETDGYEQTTFLKIPRKKGLFSHFRSFDVDNIAHIAEVQSDVFQHLEKIDDTKRIEQKIQDEKIWVEDQKQFLSRIERLLEMATKAGETDNIERYSNRLEGAKLDLSNAEARLQDAQKELENLGEPSKEQTKFLTYKNIWHERTVRELITIKAREGFDAIRFPTPRTVAVIEGFVGGDGEIMPYEIESADDHNRLTVGDTITYGGTDMTVVEAGDYVIKVAESDKVREFMHSEAVREDIDAQIDEARYEFEHNLEEYFGEINTPKKAQEVLDIINILNQHLDFINKDKKIKDTKESTYLTDEAKAEKIKELKAVKDVGAKDLKRVPEKLLKDNGDNNYRYYIENATERVLDKMVEMEDGSTFDFDYFYDDVFEEMADGYDPDYQGIYGEENVFYEEVGYDSKITVVEEGAMIETFNQPDEYETASSIEDFDLNDFEGEQRTVLEFYNKQLLKYVKKLRKENLELVEDDSGFEWWETKVTEEDKAPPTAYRIKEDLESVGINITQEQEQEILDLNKKIFGDENVKIVSQILANNKALGAYSEQIIKILDKQGDATDTFLHEAVHKYLDVFTTKDEYVKILAEAQEKYGLDNLYEVEERVAEDFIKYAKKKKVKGRKTFFDKVIARIKKFLKNQSAIDKLYEDIISGQAKQSSEDIKASKVAVSIEQNLNQRFETLAGFETRNVKSQAKLVSKLIAKDINKARDIVTGKAPLPAGISGSMFIAGVEQYATENNDIDLLRSLAVSPLVSETSVHAQELRFLAERDKTSVLSKIQEIANERAKIFKRRHTEKLEKVVKKETAKIKESVKVSKYDWNSFIKSIEC